MTTSKSKLEVLKRNGTAEVFDPNKIHKILEWAIEGYSGVSVSEIELNAELKYKHGITTTELHQALIESAKDLISLNFPNYQYVASKLLLYLLRKNVWGSHEEPTLYEFLNNMVAGGYYDEIILTDYTEEEINLCNEKLDHDRDYNFTYAGLQQMCDKYLIQNRGTGEIHETPQFAYMAIAMTLFRKYKDKNRLYYIFKCYDYISKFKISLPTPILSGVRTPLKRYASCCLIDVDDTLASLGASNVAVLNYTASRSGIGLNMGRVRAINDIVRNGEVVHTGVIPFLKWFESAVKSCQQNGIRGGGATVNFPFWHKEIEDIITLKNNAKTGDNSVRKLDYCIGFSKLFFERFLASQKTKEDVMISLFSPADVPDLYDAWGDNDKFDELYLKYESDKSIDKKQISVVSLMKLFTKERRETARIYAMFVDHTNSHSSFKELIKMTNLCVSGDQRVVSDRGMLTAKELYEQGGDLILFDNESKVKSSPMKLIETDVPTFKISLDNGLSHTVTSYHKILVSEKDKRGREHKITKECRDLKIGDRVAIQTNKGIFGNKDMQKEAFLLGLYQSDGTQYQDKIAIDVWENDFDLLEEIQTHFNDIHYKYKCNEIEVVNQTGIVGTREISPAQFTDSSESIYSNVKKKRLMSKTLRKALNFEKGYVPQWIWESNEETQWEYVRGLLYADGTAFVSKSSGNPIQINYTDINKAFLEELQILFLNLGLQCSIRVSSEEGEAQFHKGQKKYKTKKVWRLIIGNKPDALQIEKHTGFLSRKNIVLEDREYRNNTKKYYDVVSVEYAGNQDVYCVSVDTKDHLWVCNGIITHNCVEITQPTIPLQSVDDPNGEIGICILSALNVLEIKSDAEMEKVCDVVVRLLDELIDHQTYPMLAAENFTKKRRSLGVGITNLAALLAKNNLRYDLLDSDAPNFVDELMEKIQFNLISTSVELAKEKGVCEKFHLTKYADGILPIDTYNKNMDKVVTRLPSLDWEALRQKVLEFGMRHSTLSAMMPCESSSVVSNSTNGIEPIKKFKIYKSSKSGKLPFIVPSYTAWKNRYTLQFDMKTNKGYSNITGALQKWTDMAISCMHYYNYEHYEGNKLPDSKLIQEFIYHYIMGNKTLYYTYSNDLDKQSASEEVVEIKESLEIDAGCESGACSL